MERYRNSSLSPNRSSIEQTPPRHMRNSPQSSRDLQKSQLMRQELPSNPNLSQNPNRSLRHEAPRSSAQGEPPMRPRSAGDTSASASAARNRSIERREKLIDSAVVLILLVSMGFPGRYTRLLGGSSSTLLEYGTFGLQLVLMLFSSGRDGVMSIKLLDLKQRYTAVYCMAVVFFADSMFVTRYPSEQIITCVRFTVTILFALWMADRYDGEDILRLICTAQMVFVVLTLLYCVLFPGTIFSKEQGEHDFIGFLRTKNNEAAELSVGILFQIARFKLQRARREIPQRWELMLFVVQGMMLFLCNAKGALFCVAIPAAYLLFVEGRNDPEWRLPLGLVYVVGSVGFLIAALTILPLMEPLLSAIGKDATLTGRTPLWRQIILVMTNSHTFTGYGFGMFWRDRQAVALLHTAFRSNSFMGTMTTGAHNVLLEYWLNVGLFGLASYFIALLASFRQMRKLERQNYIFCAAYMLWFMVMGWTERSMSTYEYQMVFLFLAMGVGSNKPRPVSRRRARLEKEAT